MSKHAFRIASGILLLSFLTAGLALAQDDIQRQTTSTSNGSPTVLSSALIADTNPYVAPMQDHNWFVIVGSYPKRQRNNADARASYVQGKGYNMAVYDSNDFEGLTPGLWVVMDGPYTQSHAQGILNNVRSVVRDAYIKRAVHQD